MVLDTPYLVHHQGKTLAGPESPLVGPELRWARDLYRIQQTILPTEYTTSAYECEPPAPPGYMRQIFEHRGIPFQDVLEEVSNMHCSSQEGVESCLAAEWHRRLPPAGGLTSTGVAVFKAAVPPAKAAAAAAVVGAPVQPPQAGASGDVGTEAVQLLVDKGATVVGTKAVQHLVGEGKTRGIQLTGDHPRP